VCWGWEEARETLSFYMGSRGTGIERRADHYRLLRHIPRTRCSQSPRASYKELEKWVCLQAEFVRYQRHGELREMGERVYREVITVADLLDGERVDYPPAGQVNVTFKKAPKKQTPAEQVEIF
jgi:hypothetical protein